MPSIGYLCSISAGTGPLGATKDPRWTARDHLHLKPCAPADWAASLLGCESQLDPSPSLGLDYWGARALITRNGTYQLCPVNQMCHQTSPPLKLVRITSMIIWGGIRAKCAQKPQNMRPNPIGLANPNPGYMTLRWKAFFSQIPILTISLDSSPSANQF